MLEFRAYMPCLRLGPQALMVITRDHGNLFKILDVRIIPLTLDGSL